MIGLFDSGSGGLTVLKALRERLPSADVLYYGDIANAPYGSRTREELSLLTVKALEFLQKNGAEAIVSACNSVSASLAVSLFDTLELAPKQLIEMVGPTVSAFKGSTERILLLATPATVSSGIYQNAFRMIGKDIEARPIEKLAEQIEFGASDEEIEKTIQNALRSLPEVDVVVLACTHYPLALPAFKKVLGEIPIFDPADVVAERAERLFWPREVGRGATRFVITKESAPFRALVAAMFPKGQYAIEVV